MIRSVTRARTGWRVIPIDPGSDLSHLDDYSDLAKKVDSLEKNLTFHLSKKSDANHTHTVEDIINFDLSDYYNKSSIDALLSKVKPEEHTHLEADIADLNKYTKEQTRLVVGDHSNLKNNPHEVTKDQVGLGNVENLSVSEIFNHEEFPVSSTDITDLHSHLENAKNPHGVNKWQVDLGNVPNINVDLLLKDHISSQSPHSNVYTKDEADDRIDFFIGNSRYEYTPSEGDSGGSIGDIAYDSDSVYFKLGDTDWRKVNTSKVSGEIELDNASLFFDTADQKLKVRIGSITKTIAFE